MTQPAPTPVQPGSVKPAPWAGLLRRYRETEHIVLGVVSVVLFLIFWQGLATGYWAALVEPLIGEEYASVLRVKPIFISSPTRLAEKTVEMAASGELWEHVSTSLIALTLGSLIAIVVGIPLGLAVGWYRRLRYALEPFLLAYNATPQVVFLPLLIIWAGTGLTTRVIIIAMVTFIPLTMSAWAAVKTTDARLLKVARSFGSSDWRLFCDIILPSSVPFLLAGLRLAVGRTMVGIVVGELYGASAGLGHLINVAGSSFRTDVVFVGILSIAVIGLLLTWVIHRLELHFERWRPRPQAT